MFNIYPYLNVNDLNLDWIIAHFKEFIDEIASLDDWRTQHEQEYAQLKAFMDAINAGNFPPSMYAAMRTWLETNAIDIVGEMVKHVYFGLDDNGHFMVTIPEQWRELVFKTTGYDYTALLQPEFGHLCILY